MNQLFMIIETICYNGTLDVTFGPDSHLDPYSRSFMQYWYDIEQAWLQIPGAKPHYGKLFGIENRATGGFRSFGNTSIQKLLTMKQKKELTSTCNTWDPKGVFSREFGNQMAAIDGLDLRGRKSVMSEDLLAGIDSSYDQDRYRWCSFYFFLVLIPYWLSGILYHAAGMYLMLKVSYQQNFNERCLPAEEGTLTFWYMVRGIVGFLAIWIHIFFLPSRCKNMPGKLVQNKEQGEMFWRILPLCDILIGCFLASALNMLVPLNNCGLANLINIEYFSCFCLGFTLIYRMQARFRGVYVKTFKYMGGGHMVCQKKATGAVCDCRKSAEIAADAYTTTENS
jgi:hypothetical protein